MPFTVSVPRIDEKQENYTNKRHIIDFVRMTLVGSYDDYNDDKFFFKQNVRIVIVGVAVASLLGLPIWFLIQNAIQFTD